MKTPSKANFLNGVYNLVTGGDWFLGVFVVNESGLNRRAQRSQRQLFKRSSLSPLGRRPLGRSPLRPPVRGIDVRIQVLPLGFGPRTRGVQKLVTGSGHIVSLGNGPAELVTRSPPAAVGRDTKRRDSGHEPWDCLGRICPANVSQLKDLTKKDLRRSLKWDGARAQLGRDKLLHRENPGEIGPLPGYRAREK